MHQSKKSVKTEVTCHILVKSKSAEGFYEIWKIQGNIKYKQYKRTVIYYILSRLLHKFGNNNSHCRSCMKRNKKSNANAQKFMSRACPAGWHLAIILPKYLKNHKFCNKNGGVFFCCLFFLIMGNNFAIIKHDDMCQDTTWQNFLESFSNVGVLFSNVFIKRDNSAKNDYITKPWQYVPRHSMTKLRWTYIGGQNCLRINNCTQKKFTHSPPSTYQHTKI